MIVKSILRRLRVYAFTHSFEFYDAKRSCNTEMCTRRCRLVASPGEVVAQPPIHSAIRWSIPFVCMQCTIDTKKRNGRIRIQRRLRNPISCQHKRGRLGAKRPSRPMHGSKSNSSRTGIRYAAGVYTIHMYTTTPRV